MKLVIEGKVVIRRRPGVSFAGLTALPLADPRKIADLAQEWARHVERSGVASPREDLRKNGFKALQDLNGAGLVCVMLALNGRDRFER